jgi:arylsulfatase A-like enzyme
MVNKLIFFLPVIFIFQFTEAISQKNKQPNIIFVLADDLGWTDINTFDPMHRGYYETPNIDKLAKQGMKFNQAYSNAANCSPTRAALISGQYYPHQPIYHVGAPSQGKMIPAPNAHALPLDKITIAEALKQAGYRTGFIGKWHIGELPTTGPKQQGFDINVGGYNAGNPSNWEGGYFQPNNNPYIHDARKGEYLTDYLTRKAIGFIEDYRKGSFYLQLSYYTPHSPYQAPEQLVQKYKQKKGVDGHDNPIYAAMIESLDRSVGQLMHKLDDLGIAKNTIFIFYSDNGGRGGYGFLGHEENNITDNSPLKGGKTTFYEGGIRVPLIVRWPEVIEPGTQSEEPVISIDFYPTFLDAAGIGKPDNYLLDGLSLLPLFKNPDTTLERQALYWHFPGYPNNPWRTGPVSVIRQGPWKLMKFYETNEIELYNLNQDISEQQNLANERPKIRQKSQNQLEKWLEQNHAPMAKKRKDNSDQ